MAKAMQVRQQASTSGQRAGMAQHLREFTRSGAIVWLRVRNSPSLTGRSAQVERAARSTIRASSINSMHRRANRGLHRNPAIAFEPANFLSPTHSGRCDVRAETQNPCRGTPPAVIRP